MRTYCRQERHGDLADKDVFLLRNQGPGKGVGFFEQCGFYPDFILWVKEGKRQRIVFVEPHGMLHAGAYLHDDKARLHETLRELQQTIACAQPGSDVRLDSYIVSATTYEDLRTRYDDGTWDMERFAGVHILFPVRTGEYDYLDRILSA